MNKDGYSKEFCRWAATYFSWEEAVDDKEVESHYMAWLACQNEVLKILNKPYSANINDLHEDRIKQIRSL